MADQYTSLASARQGASSLVGQGLKILEKLPDKPIPDENGNITGYSPGGYRVQMPNGQVGIAEPGRNSQNGTEYVIQMPAFNSSDSNNQGSDKYFVNINPDGQTAQVVNADVNETGTQGFWQNNDNLALVAASLVGGAAFAPELLGAMGAGTSSSGPIGLGATDASLGQAGLSAAANASGNAAAGTLAASEFGAAGAGSGALGGTLGAAENGILGSTVGGSAGANGSIGAAENGLFGSTVGQGAGAPGGWYTGAGDELGGGLGSGAANPSLATTAGGAAPISASLPSTVNSPNNPPANNPNAPPAQTDLLSQLMRGIGGAGSNLISGLSNPNGLASLLTSLYSANRQSQYADNLLNLYRPYNDQATQYGQRLNETYTNPGSYFSSPEWQGIQRTTGDYLQRQDAAGGRLSNDFGRASKLQDLASGQIGNYRQGLASTYSNLAGIGTGQGMQNAQAANYLAGQGAAGNLGNLLSGRYSG